MEVVTGQGAAEVTDATIEGIIVCDTEGEAKDETKEETVDWTHEGQREATDKEATLEDRAEA